MANISVRYMVKRPRRDGTVRNYWQPDGALRAAGWKMERLSDDEAIAIGQAQEFNRQVDDWRLAGCPGKPHQATPGTMNFVISDYKKSRKYERLAEKTRETYDYYLEAIAKWAGTEPAASIDAAMVQDLYGELRDTKPRKAMYLIQVLRLLFSHAERHALIPPNSNPARRPDIEYRPEKGLLWPAEAVLHFVAVADKMGNEDIGTAVMLNEWWGQRRGDLVKLQTTAIRDGFVTIVQNKTGNTASLPIGDLPIEHRQRIADQLKRNADRNKDRSVVCLNFLQQRNGLCYTDEGFKSIFGRIRANAAKEMPVLRNLVFKDLRHTAVTRYAEAGVDVPGISSITGHSIEYCQQIIDTYLVRTRKLASNAMNKRREAEQK